MRTILVATIATILLAGCQSTDVGAPTRVPTETHALELAAAGRPSEAAQEYIALARGAQGSVAQDLMLQAVALLLDAGRTNRASDLMDELAAQTIATELAPRHDLLAAEVAMRRGMPDRTVELLAGAPASHFGPTSAETVHQLLARAYEDTGRFVEAARERVALDAVLVDSALRDRNRATVWDLLRRASRDRLERALEAAGGAYLGWLRLAAFAEDHRTSPFALERALTRWSAEFPDHPANETVVAGMLDAAREAIPRPTRIALLLPLRGAFSEAGIATRDGFLAAWYADASNHGRPSVEIHDISSDPVEPVYARAVEAGADFVVGPLRRGPVTSLACGDTLLVTTVVLNEIDSPAPGDGEHVRRCAPGRVVPRLYHFALVPEAEARQVAERAWFAGFSKALAFTRSGTWGERVFGAFAQEWERFGGVLLDHHVLPADSADIGESAAEALGVSQSRSRARAIGRIIGRRVEHEPRRRQDIDLVFMAAFPTEARQLIPQIAFHHGAGLPIYATSHAWSGSLDAASDRDLDGLTFGDMPWLVAPSASDRVLRGQIDAAFAGEPLKLPRLYAFGADAYRLATGLHRIIGDRSAFLTGHTGRLSVGDDHRIGRRLAWARFAGGLPVPDTPDITAIDANTEPSSSP